MDRKKALATAGALVLTASGAVSALFLTVGADNSSSPEPATATTEIVEFVDAAGNPLPAATAGVTGAQPATAPSATYGEADEEEEHDEYDEEGEEHEDEEHDEEDEEGEHDD